MSDEHKRLEERVLQITTEAGSRIFLYKHNFLKNQDSREHIVPLTSEQIEHNDIIFETPEQFLEHLLNLYSATSNKGIIKNIYDIASRTKLDIGKEELDRSLQADILFATAFIAEVYSTHNLENYEKSLLWLLRGLQTTAFDHIADFIIYRQNESWKQDLRDQYRYAIQELYVDVYGAGALMK